MLSYQHLYHAGGLADVHKHSMLCTILAALQARSRALTYVETHAGRGLYNLDSSESLKTGEAARGWLHHDVPAHVPSALLKMIKNLNQGNIAPLYPGSPLIAAHLLRPQDKMHLMELHPQEYQALCQTFKKKPFVQCRQIDGYTGVLDLAPPMPRRGLVFIDPSYEMKDEYKQVSDFIIRLHRRWKEAVIMLWYPLLPAARHQDMKKSLQSCQSDVLTHEYMWGESEKYRGMYGSGILLINSGAPRSVLEEIWTLS